MDLNFIQIIWLCLLPFLLVWKVSWMNAIPSTNRCMYFNRFSDWSLDLGVMLGGSLQMIAMGWANIGAAVAPDAALASVASAIICS